MGVIGIEGVIGVVGVLGGAVLDIVRALVSGGAVEANVDVLSLLFFVLE